MKRLQFILLAVATCIGALISGKVGTGAALIKTRRTWAELIAEDVQETGGRRAEHLLHGKYCNGSHDHLYTPDEVAKRRARCAKICGMCRYIYSLKEWPQPDYCRPPQEFLDEFEAQESCLTWCSEAPYNAHDRPSSLSR